MKQVLIILRGAPASGKSTIAKKLRDFSKKIVWLKVDNFKDFFEEKSEIILNDVNKMAINSLEYLLNNGFSVVMEAVFQNPAYVELALNTAKQKNISAYAYELDCSLPELQRRDKTREGTKESYRQPLGDAEIERLFNIIQKNKLEGIIPLNTENMSVEETIKIFENILFKND